MHVKLFNELGRDCQTTRCFTYCAHFAFNVVLYLLFDYVPFNEKLVVVKGIANPPKVFLIVFDMHLCTIFILFLFEI